MTKELIDYYGKDVADDIMMLIRRIMIDSLTGNTIDAFASRLIGKPAPNSDLGLEFFIFISSVPFILPLIPFIKIPKLLNKVNR